MTAPKLRAITIWQPWASLIAAGAKRYEFRSWAAPEWIIGQRIAIHAGSRKCRRDEVHWLYQRLGDINEPPCLHLELAKPVLELELRRPGSLPLSHVLCTAILGEPKLGDECAKEFGWPGRGSNDSDREGTFNWGWPLTDIELLEPPEPARGFQGFWPWP